MYVEREKAKTRTHTAPKQSKSKSKKHSENQDEMNDLGERTSITAYEDEVEVMKRARRELERELDEDIPLHVALTMFSEMYLDSPEE